MNKRRIKIALDILMTLLLGFLMAYSLVGDRNHEIAGLLMIALMGLHHGLNGGFHRRLFSGRYTALRATLTAVDAAMLAVFLMQGVSGLAMARHVRLLPAFGGAAWARKVHLLGAYWGFALCGVHAGIHMTPLLKRWRRIESPALRGGSALIALCGFGYGIAAAVRRGLPDYMTLRNQFVFFDYREPLALFFLDYAFILFACMAIGCGVGWALRRAEGRRSIR